MELKICPYCGAENLSVRSGVNLLHVTIDCPSCGSYEIKTKPNMTNEDIKDEVASYLYYHSINSFPNKNYPFKNFLGEKTLYDAKIVDCNNIAYVSKEAILSFQPKTFADRIDRVLLGFAEQTGFLGEKVKLLESQLYSALFIKRHDTDGNKLNENDITAQLHEIINYLEENKYIEYYYHEGPIFILKPDGWKRVDELQKYAKLNSKTVFVAMSFAEEMKPVEDAIRAVIIECGFVPMIIKDKEYNRQIVPEILYEIRQAKFVIAEFTNHNNGAYYEAGYAYALGKEVIHLCNDDSFDKDAHFDIKQVNTIRWNKIEDLEQKLIKRIKATIL